MRARPAHDAPEYTHMGPHLVRPRLRTAAGPKQPEGVWFPEFCGQGLKKLKSEPEEDCEGRENQTVAMTRTGSASVCDGPLY